MDSANKSYFIALGASVSLVVAAVVAIGLGIDRSGVTGTDLAAERSAAPEYVVAPTDRTSLRR